MTDHPGEERLESKVVRRGRELVKPRPEDPLAWAENVFTLLELVRGPDHAAVRALRTHIDSAALRGQGTSTIFQDAVRGVAQGLLNDLESGFLPDLATRIRADVEGDLLGQAHRLLEEGLKDPAAMLVGAVLEDALRQLCRKYDVTEGNTIESMNVPLRKAGVYPLPQQQQVTAWAAIRNKADHGHFAEYTEAEVRQMQEGVAGFVARYLTEA